MHNDVPRNSNSTNGSAAGGSQRLEAISLARNSKWEELEKLIETDPQMATQVDSYGMLPLHWACTEPHAIEEHVLINLLKAFPQGAKATNTADMLPLQIAIKAQAKVEWIQALLASYPEAVLKKVPSGENAVQLAQKHHLPMQSVKLLEEMLTHVCQQPGYAHQERPSLESRGSQSRSQPSPIAQQDMTDRSSRSSENKISMSGVRLVDPAMAESLQRYMSDSTSQQSTARSSAIPLSTSVTSSGSNIGLSKTRTYSDNDFRSTSSSELASGRAGPDKSFSSGSMSASISKPLPYQTSTQLASRTIVSLPPRWTNAPNCHICSAKFGTFKKRHHCRNCGQSICRDHSAKNKLRLPHYGLQDRHRVCTMCYDLLRNADKELLQPSQGRFTSVTARTSEEYSTGPMSMHSSMADVPRDKVLERHVSAPARQLGNSGEFQGIHEQVATLQRQVSQLMEEKEMAENTLRLQAQLLNGALGGTDPRSQTLVKRDRLNSLPLKLSSDYDVPIRQVPMLMNAPEAVPPPRYMEREVDIDQATAEVNAMSMAGQPMVNRLPSLSVVSSYSDLNDDDVYPVRNIHSRESKEFDDIDEDENEEEETTGAIAAEDEEEDEGSALPEVDVLVNLGISLLNKGSNSGARAAFERAVEICPNDPVLYSYLGKAFYAEQDLENAIAAVTKSLALEPSAANSTLLGKMLFEKGDHEKAIEAYQKSLEIQQVG